MAQFGLPCTCGNEVRVDSGDAGRAAVCENCSREISVPEYSTLVATATPIMPPMRVRPAFQFTLGGFLGLLLVATVSIHTATIAWNVASSKWIFLTPWIAFSFAGVIGFRVVAERRPFFVGFALAGLISLRLILAMYGYGYP